MAGVQPGFDAPAFKAGIRLAWVMAAAPQEARQPVFHFAVTTTSTDPMDDADVPFDPDSDVDASAPDPVRLPSEDGTLACGVEFFDNAGQPANGFGIIQPTSVRITCFDEEYALVGDATYVMIDGDRYERRSTEPPSGLFSAGMFVMHFAATSET